MAAWASCGRASPPRMAVTGRMSASEAILGDITFSGFGPKGGRGPERLAADDLRTTRGCSGCSLSAKAAKSSPPPVDDRAWLLSNRLMASLRPFSPFLLGLAVLAAGCGGNDATGPAGPSKLETTDLVVGTGAEAKSGDVVTVHYIGSFLTGKVFESSYSGGRPITFTLGAGQVIAGWDRGIVGMKVGGKRLLVIPADLAYGSRGAGSTIPPNTPLQFEVELVSIQGK